MGVGICIDLLFLIGFIKPMCEVVVTRNKKRKVTKVTAQCAERESCTDIVETVDDICPENKRGECSMCALAPEVQQCSGGCLLYGFDMQHIPIDTT